MNLYLSSFRYAPSITFFNESISEWRTSTSKFVYFCFLNDSKAVLTYSSFFSAGVITEIKLFIAVAPFFFFQQLIREREPLVLLVFPVEFRLHCLACLIVPFLFFISVFPLIVDV